uniref:Endonuclease n=1 Tax=Neogobius melanostomus TaxID=47308 RepID=A0A8C6U3F1_9GOBI
LRMDLLLLSGAVCAESFLKGHPPQIPDVLENGQIQDRTRYKTICQTYKNQRRFFTLYDTANKIPVFSAYIFKGSKTGRPRNLVWMTEPNNDKKSQASDNDYKNNSGYDRGHLYPSSYGYSREDKNSTFTLTNIVPQARTFNQRSWSNMEQCVKRFMEKHCIDNNNQIKGFLVTGAEPGNKLLNEKINIPLKMWSAFCCYNSTKKKWFASAHWGDNVADTNDRCLNTNTLDKLYSKFSKGTTAFKLFPEELCPSDVSRFVS